MWDKAFEIALRHGLLEDWTDVVEQRPYIDNIMKEFCARNNTPQQMEFVRTNCPELADELQRVIDANRSTK